MQLIYRNGAVLRSSEFLSLQLHSSEFEFFVNGRITEGIKRKRFNNFDAPRKGPLPFHHAWFLPRFQERAAIFFIKNLLSSCIFSSSSGVWLSYVVGEVIISENPYVSVPNKNKESPQSKCEWCFSSTNLKKCSACHVVWYCSSRCQVKNGHNLSDFQLKETNMVLSWSKVGLFFWLCSCIVCGEWLYLWSFSEVRLEVAFCRMQGAVESRQGKSEITHAILTFDGEAMYTAKAGNWEGEWLLEDSDCSAWV